MQEPGSNLEKEDYARQAREAGEKYVEGEGLAADQEEARRQIAADKAKKNLDEKTAA